LLTKEIYTLVQGNRRLWYNFKRDNNWEIHFLV